MKKMISIILVIALAAGLTACREAGSSGNSTDDLTSSRSSVTSQSTTPSEKSAPSEETSADWSYESDRNLKGKELITKFEWPYDDTIDLLGAAAKAENALGVFEDIPLSEISNDFSWNIICDYGYLAMLPENGSKYEYKKYKAGDKIGNFTVAQISTWFDNRNFELIRYFSGTRANFEGEMTLAGEISIVPDEYPVSGEIKFYPDEESCRKLPVVNFMPKLNITNSEEYSYDNLMIELGNRTDYPEIEFKNIPADGTRVRVKIKINDYGYRALCGLPFLGSATIADGIIEIL